MTATRDDTAQKVMQALQETLKIDASQIKPDATLRDLGADSLDIAEISMAVKDEFGYDLTEDEIAKIKNVHDFINTLSNHDQVLSKA